jgi:hypothetical protein
VQCLPLPPHSVKAQVSCIAVLRDIIPSQLSAKGRGGRVLEGGYCPLYSVSVSPLSLF